MELSDYKYFSYGGTGDDTAGICNVGFGLDDEAHFQHLCTEEVSIFATVIVTILTPSVNG
jgi:hypothetical protein